MMDDTPTDSNATAATDTQLDRALNSYADRFGCNFPLLSVGTVEESKLLTLIEDCVERGRPYEPRYKDDADY